jgi:hypothetical protein
MSDEESKPKFYTKLPAIVPIVLVNAVSVTGQVFFWKDHLPWPLILCIGFAIALESVAVYLAYHASLAEMSQDSAFKLRIASYAFGAIIGLLNGSHFLNHGSLTAASIGMGLLSASSPWLWAIQARRASRDELKAKGLIDDRSVRLGLRWVFYPSDSFQVFRHAVWTGESNPVTAIKSWEVIREEDKREKAQIIEASNRVAIEAGKPEADEEDARKALDSAGSKADRVRVALRYAGVEDAPNYAPMCVAWLRDRGITDVTPNYVRQIHASDKRREGDALASDRRTVIHAVRPKGVAR